MTIFCTILIGVIKIKIGAYILLEFSLERTGALPGWQQQQEWIGFAKEFC